MATHDYVIANGTGAAVRSDLNGALAAIVSNNSGATEPATMYAYQWWADTTTGLLKLRNSANSAWVTIFELDGTLAVSDISLGAGTVGAPSLFFTGDSNTGLFSPGADTLALATGGTQRATVDSSGRLLVGTSTTEGFGAKLQIRDDGGLNCEMFRSVASASGPTLALNKSRGSAGSPTVVSSGDVVSYIAGKGYDGAAYQEAATIKVEVDGTPGANDMPGRLVFSTTADGAASPTERVRISQNGNVSIGTTSNLYNARLACSPISGTSGSAFFTDTATEYGTILINTATSGNNGFGLFQTEATPVTRGSIVYNRAGGVVAYNTTSDYRAKTLLGALENPGETIDALKVYRGVMNGATIERPMLIAHEAQEVAPYCVTGEKDAVDDDGNPIYQQMDHQVLVPLLIAEIQQLRARVVALEGN